jgi:negative regulator of sigma E activity
LAIAAAAVLITAWTVHHATPKDEATSRPARPAQATASNTSAFSRAVHLARTGTCVVCSANVFLPQTDSVQAKRRLRHHTSTAPPTGTSRTRCSVR